MVGDRAFGDRSSKAASVDAITALAGVYLLAPQIPMIFMGEEWSACTPFPYFCDFDGELNEAVLEGRRQELARLPGFDEDSAASTPDPTSLETFRSAKIRWTDLDQRDHRAMLEVYRHLIDVRHRELVPFLNRCTLEPTDGS